MTARIPVFVSAPSALSSDQQASYDYIVELLRRENLEHRALGRTDYGVDVPLKEVFSIARHCAGGVVLGFEQMRAERAESKMGTPVARVLNNVSIPTPWNQLEAGILFALRLPLLIFRQPGITGGIFDNGVSDAYVQELPIGVSEPHLATQSEVVIKTWAGRVRENYRSY
ncbi:MULTISPECIES: hypothetical protein [Brachybacterium]|uniref:hypothetical protein n=1 Tax=Brachybacterium TaxID=43668 RepID=UPI0011E070BA|nr:MULTISPECIES: hypothetical protein [Bacteria]